MSGKSSSTARSVLPRSDRRTQLQKWEYDHYWRRLRTHIELVAAAAETLAGPEEVERVMGDLDKAVRLATLPAFRARSSKGVVVPDIEDEVEDGQENVDEAPIPDPFCLEDSHGGDTE